mmetsp:Transcript_41878/g.125343  ORF Transcript_41878/g.125343 Transcript_41878/m.125343 type:complete len:890 (-) Transcript_41878:2379-5048(-)
MGLLEGLKLPPVEEPGGGSGGEAGSPRTVRHLLSNLDMRMVRESKLRGQMQAEGGELGASGTSAATPMRLHARAELQHPPPRHRQVPSGTSLDGGVSTSSLSTGGGSGRRASLRHVALSAEPVDGLLGAPLLSGAAVGSHGWRRSSTGPLGGRPPGHSQPTSCCELHLDDAESSGTTATSPTSVQLPMPWWTPDLPQLQARSEPSRQRLESKMRELGSSIDPASMRSRGSTAGSPQGGMPRKLSHLTGVDLTSMAISALEDARRVLEKAEECSSDAQPLDSQRAGVRSTNADGNGLPKASKWLRLGPSSVSSGQTRISRPGTGSVRMPSNVMSAFLGLQEDTSFAGQARRRARLLEDSIAAGERRIALCAEMARREAEARRVSLLHGGRAPTPAVFPDGGDDDNASSDDSDDGGGMALTADDAERATAAQSPDGACAMRSPSGACSVRPPAPDALLNAVGGTDSPLGAAAPGRPALPTRPASRSEPLGFFCNGTPPHSVDSEPFSGVYGRQDDLLRRMNQAKLCIMQANPVAFEEEIAALAEVGLTQCSQVAKAKLRDAQAAAAEVRKVENFMSAVTTMHTERPFFKPPTSIPKERHVRKVVEKKKIDKPAWELQKSIFWTRRKECESRSCYDTDAVMANQFQLDWARIAEKSRFRRLVGRTDAAVSQDNQRLEGELAEVRQELDNYKAALRSIFNYYCVTSGPMDSTSFLSMGLNTWLQFCNDTGITDNSQRGCSTADLSNVFIAVNFEEESGTVESDANDDDEMMRFEFYEGIVRAAFGKFIVPGIMDDASDAVARFIEDEIIARVPAKALIMANNFREFRLYNEQVENVVMQHYDILMAAFKLYKAKDRTKYFAIEHWAAFLEGCNLMGEHLGINKSSAKLIFIWR